MEFNLIIRNGTVIDGSGQPGVAADVGIRGDRIAAVDDLAAATAAQTLDATGKVVSPGFIDIHTHSDFTLLLDPQGEGMVRQGVTTNVIGNCSLGCYPVRSDDRAALQETLVWLSAADVEWDWTDLDGYRRRFNSQGAALNVASLVGPHRDPHGCDGLRPTGTDGRRTGGHAPPGSGGDGARRRRHVGRVNLRAQRVR